jgi:hypothetical protein
VLLPCNISVQRGKANHPVSHNSVREKGIHPKQLMTRKFTLNILLTAHAVMADAPPKLWPIETALLTSNRPCLNHFPIQD